MIASKHMPKLVAVFLCLCLLFCGFVVYASNAFTTVRNPDYQEKLFAGDVVSLDIQVDNDVWQDFLDKAEDKPWIPADVVINGQRFGTIGIRPKGNSTLVWIAGSRGAGNNNSFSLHFKADKYVRGQTFFGLDTFCVNNMMGDATYMKDFVSYDMMRFIGVDAPLVNYASVTVNGADYGFGLMLERYDRSYLNRVYGAGTGQLYNVKWQMAPPGEMGGLQPGMRPAGGNIVRNAGGSLVYTDDDIGSYSAIFDNAIFSNIVDRDKKRVITALKNLQTGTDLERYVDVDATLRYFAAHTTVVNLDSYISNLQQNYYLYERDGRLHILPWDYNFAFGGFSNSDASGTVNFPIDTPVSAVSMEERPLLNKLLEVEAYKERYHGYLRQIAEDYIESGLLESTVYAVDAKIRDYVQDDVSAFFSFARYEASLPVLIELMYLRAESIKGQLDGSIPSTSRGQILDYGSRIDASALNLNLFVLGSAMGGGMRGVVPVIVGQNPQAQKDSAGTGTVLITAVLLLTLGCATAFIAKSSRFKT